MNNVPFSSRVLGILLGGVLLLSLGEGVYSFRLSNRLTELERSLSSALNSRSQTIQKLSQRMDEAEARNVNLQREVASTKDHLGMTHGELQKTSQVAFRLAKQQKESSETLGGLSSDVVGVKQEVSHAKEELASARSDWQRVIGDLGVQSDMIAHNRSELEELKLRGERDYYEFYLRKSKRPERVANIAMALKKTDVKRQKYTLTLVADDRTIEKKDKTANEPVQFYQERYRQPTEIVVNQIYSDHIVGYLSVPKKKEVRSTGTTPGPENTKTGS